MGYTHYWCLYDVPNPEVLRACVAEMAQVVADCQVPLGDRWGEGEPEIAEDRIAFNGRGRNAHESFVFPGKTPSGPVDPTDFFSQFSGFNFTKTAYKPYDCVVTACLLVVAHHFPDGGVRVSSDGAYPTEWAEGRALYERVTGRPSPAVLPAPHQWAELPL
jgi:hypothetical protein